MHGAARKLGGDDSIYSREGRSKAAQSAELRELHCPISVSYHCHHLPPGNQEPWSYKLPPLFQLALLAGAAQLLPQPWSHSPPLSQRLPIPAGHPNSTQCASRRGTITSIAK